MDANKVRSSKRSSKIANTHHKPSPHLEDFIRRANKAKIRTEEPGQGRQEETWEVIDGDVVQGLVQEDQDDLIKNEWTLVDGTKGEEGQRD